MKAAEAIRRQAIIAGTGIDDEFKGKTYEISTPFGNVNCQFVQSEGTEVIFLARHGMHHSIPPHKINYRANMYALKKLGVTEIFGICAVGSMNEKFPPGSIVALVDYIDFTKNREDTYYDGDFYRKVSHLDPTEAYCKRMRDAFVSKGGGEFLAGEGVYVCTEGPRFETAAEIRMYRMIGADVVGMTNATECALAKELGMCYQGYGIVSNWATGYVGPHSRGEILTMMRDNRRSLLRTFAAVFADSENVSCTCSRRVDL